MTWSPSDAVDGTNYYVRVFNNADPPFPLGSSDQVNFSTTTLSFNVVTVAGIDPASQFKIDVVAMTLYSGNRYSQMLDSYYNFGTGVYPPDSSGEISYMATVLAQQWLTSSELTDTRKLDTCNCVLTKTAYTSYDQKYRFDRTRILGNCCAHICLSAITVIGGSGYTTASVLAIQGGAPGSAGPALLAVTGVDVSGAITSVSILQNNPYYVVPTAPYMLVLINGTGAGAFVSSLTWNTNCAPCGPSVGRQNR